MIIILAVAGFLLLLTGVFFLLKDFSRFILKKTTAVNYPKTFIDFGQHAVTGFSVISITVLAFLFYKFAMTLVAYVLSDNLISFFRILRGVYSTTSESQNPFSVEHLISGLLLTPALQFITFYFIYCGIRTFMFDINKRYDSASYEESDVLYFGFLSVVAFIFLEILFYSQSIPAISGVAHTTYLAVSKISSICFYLAISHVHLLKNERYKASLPAYVHLNKLESIIINSPWKTILLTYAISIILNLPFFTGTQFISNNWFLIIIYLVSCAVFLLTLKYFLSSGFNYLGVIMLMEGPDQLTPNRKLLEHTTERKILYGLGALSLIFAIIRLKLFLLVLVCLIAAGLIYLFLHTSVYLFTLMLSLYRAKKIKADRPKITIQEVRCYLFATVKAVFKGAIPMVGFIFFVTILISVFPKKYKYKNENYIHSVFDEENNPLFIEYTDNNGCIPIPSTEFSEFLLKCLYTKEDRNFRQQNSWLPKLSNWHGVSISSLYRFFTGGGGSNLNMQLIKNVAFPKTFPQDVSRKFSETLAAYQLSLQCSPEEIVTYYLNKVGLNGGQGHSGIMAASLYTFGLPVNQLNPLEMMYLIATLKNGSEFKISSGNINYSEAVSHSQEIKTTLLEQAKSWYKQELVSKKEFNALKNQELRFVSSKFITPCQTTTKQFFSNQLSKADNKGCTYKTSISLANQQAIQTAVKDFDNEFSNFQKNGSYDLYSAALVIDIKTGEIIGHYGSKGISDLTTLSGGSNMGSLTKPFILCDLLEMGFSADNIQLYDGPIQGQATPQDYSRKYSYRMVGIDEALGKSLNAAFVNVRQLTEPIGLFNNVENHFSQMGIPADPYLQLNDPKRRQENILNYPLGSRNMTLFNIAQAYQTIFNNGLYIKLSALNSYYDPYNNVTVEIPKVSRQIYAANNANRIKVALHHTMMEGGTGNHLNKILVSKSMFYAKTGTTDGSKAGYTVLSDGETLIVTYVTYGEVGNDHLRLGLAPIPFGGGGRSAGVLAALIYNEMESK